ncbi:MAG: hypothetical protein DWQ10_00680 [Calditrichaeota bacterium]|nr:MAG: hypothetical protein DWQ10_00680 [Calditrichota bacterium]
MVILILHNGLKLEIHNVLTKIKPGSIMAFDKFEEYKLFVAATDRLSDRRQNIGNTYLTVNSIILGAIAILIRDVKFDELYRSLVIILALIIGILTNIAWKQIILKYKLLVNHRIAELKKMENEEEMINCHKMYHTEDILYPADENGDPIPGKSLNISDKEKWLPNIFTVSYVSFAIGLLLKL